MPTRDQIEDVLREVIDPELRKDIVSLGMVRSIDIHDERPCRRRGLVDHRRLSDPQPLPERPSPTRSAASGFTEVGVSFDVLSDQEKQALSQRLGRGGGLPQGALARSRT